MEPDKRTVETAESSPASPISIISPPLPPKTTPPVELKAKAPVELPAKLPPPLKIRDHSEPLATAAVTHTSPTGGNRPKPDGVAPAPAVVEATAAELKMTSEQKVPDCNLHLPCVFNMIYKYYIVKK